MLKYIPYVLMFAVATMIIYGWGLWRTMHQKQDLSNMLCSKGISKVKKALKKNKSLTKKELEPFVKDLTAKQPFNSERIGVTDPNAFLDSILTPKSNSFNFFSFSSSSRLYPREAASIPKTPLFDG